MDINTFGTIVSIFGLITLLGVGLFFLDLGKKP
jgi:hypothetical protein